MKKKKRRYFAPNCITTWVTSVPNPPPPLPTGSLLQLLLRRRYEWRWRVPHGDAGVDARGPHWRPGLLLSHVASQARPRPEESCQSARDFLLFKMSCGPDFALQEECVSRSFPKARLQVEPPGEQASSLVSSCWRRTVNRISCWRDTVNAPSCWERVDCGNSFLVKRDSKSNFLLKRDC